MKDEHIDQKTKIKELPLRVSSQKTDIVFMGGCWHFMTYLATADHFLGMWVFKAENYDKHLLSIVANTFRN